MTSDSRNPEIVERSSAATPSRVTRRRVLAQVGMAGLAAPAAAGLLTTGLAPQRAAAQQPEDDGEIIQARLLSDLITTDPALIGNTSDHSIAVLLYNGLLRFAPGGVEVEPDLATEWSVSEDGLVYTFTLRQGVQFHKGYGELTSADVAFSLNRVSDPDLASQFAGDVSIISSIETPDPYTVVITLSEPFSPFISAVIAFRPGWIVSQAAVEEKGADWPNDPIGSGPYQWEGRSIGTDVTLVRNPDYFDEVDIETVAFKFVQEDSVTELALQSGDLDLAYLFAPESSQRVLDGQTSGVTGIQIPSFRTQWAGFNFSSENVQDINVRKAIIHAIDKHATADAVAGDLAQVVSSIFNPNIPGVIDPDPFPYDPELAQSLLAEAGFADGLDLTVLVIPSSTWPDLVTIAQEQWRQVGINATLLTPERAVYDEMADSGTGYDLITSNITRSEAYQYASYFVSTNIPSPNWHNYANPDVDEIIAAATREPDEEARLELWRQFQTIVLVDDVVGFGFTNVNYVIAHTEAFSNVAMQYVDSYPIWQITAD